jgi:hypothetical protein
MKSRPLYSPSHCLLFIARRLKNVQLYERRDRSTLAETDRRASDVTGPGTAVAANRQKEAVCHKTFNEAVRRSRTALRRGLSRDRSYGREDKTRYAGLACAPNETGGSNNAASAIRDMEAHSWPRTVAV